MALTTEDLQAISTLLYPIQDSICLLQKDMTEVKSDIAGLKTDVAVLKTDVAGLKTDVAVLKTDVADLKADVAGLKTEVSSLKADVAGLKTEVANLKTGMKNLERRMDQLETELHKINFHLETETDPGINLIAENHLALIDKLNEAIPAADKSRAYEVKVNYLIGEVQALRTDVDMLKEKSKTA